MVSRSPATAPMSTTAAATAKTMELIIADLPFLGFAGQQSSWIAHAGDLSGQADERTAIDVHPLRPGRSLDQVWSIWSGAGIPASGLWPGPRARPALVARGRAPAA